MPDPGTAEWIDKRNLQENPPAVRSFFGSVNAFAMYFPILVIIAILATSGSWCNDQDEYNEKVNKTLERIDIFQTEFESRIKTYSTEELFHYLIRGISPARMEPMLKEYQQREDSNSVFEEWLDTAAPKDHLEQSLLAAVVASNMDNKDIRQRTWRQTSLKMIEYGIWWDSLLPYLGRELVTPREEVRLLESLRQEIGANETAEKRIAERVAVLKRRIAEEERERPDRDQVRDGGNPDGNSGTIAGDPEHSPGRAWWPGIFALAVLLGSIGFAWFSKRRPQG